jgi:hypothetical protein
VPDEQVVTDLVDRIAAFPVVRVAADQAGDLSWLLAAENGALTFPRFETPLLGWRPEPA